MPRKTVIVEKKGNICHVTINRPEIMNAFNWAVNTGLEKAFEKIRGDSKIRVVILQGAGEHFSSGADMRLLYEGGTVPSNLQMMKSLSRLIIAMRELPQPIICKVRGVAYGVGVNMALAGDFVIAAHDARLCEVFVNIGAIMDGGGQYLLPRLVGLAKARELALLGDEISGKQAAEIGLIYKSVPKSKLDREVNALADRLTKQPPLAMALIKEGLEGSLDMSIRQMMEWEASHQPIALQTKDHKDAVKAFLISHGKSL